MNDATMSPKWTRVVKEGRRLKHATGKSPMPSKPRLTPSREKKTRGIVGTGAGGSIQAITTKSVSVFARLTWREKRNYAMTSLEKIDAVQTRFGSFKVTAVRRGG